jgi:hypothetical protein
MAVRSGFGALAFKAKAACAVTARPVRLVGNLDFHDGHIVAISRTGDKMQVTIEGSSGKHYVVGFDGVTSVESESPEGMMLYAFGEVDAEAESLRRFEFINWYVDEPAHPQSKSHLRIVANNFTLADSD